MAYNTNTGIIYIDTNANPNVGVSIYDLQRALGRGEHDLGLLCSDKKWSGSSLVRANATNPLAKYKPVRHDALAVLSLVQRASKRYGFAAGLPPTLDLTQNNLPQNDWVYLPPRGKGGGEGGADEWYRIRDFEGYAVGACTPLVVSTGQLVYDANAESQILLFGNGMSNAIRQDGKTWVDDQSLSLSELLDSGSSSVYEYYISFLLIDKTDYAKNLLVTNKTMGVFVGDEYASFIFPVYAQGQTVSGVTYPAVPILESSRSGHTFCIIACLLPGNNPPSGYGYSVYTSSTTPAVSTLIPYSLGFASGCDRTEAVLDTGAFMMDGTTITGWNVIVTDMATEETISGQVFRAYSLEIRATFSTVGAEAYTGTMTISGMMDFNTSGRFGPTLNDSGSLPAQGVAATLESKTAGQNKLLWSSGGVNYMWVPKVNDSVVRTSLGLSVEFDYPFRAGHHATDTHTAYIPN